MRRARQGRFPPRLAAPEREAPAPPRPPPPRVDRAPAARSRFGPAELLTVARRIARRDPQATQGVPVRDDCGYDDVLAAWREIWGWDPAAAGPARIPPAATSVAFGAALARVTDVATRGGRIAFATGAPVALLALYVEIARRAETRGAVLATDEPGGDFHDRGRRALRIAWIAGVAVVTDGHGLLEADAREAADEWLFRIARPDLVVADAAFAGAALADGVETVVFADLDGVAAALVAPPVPAHVVPLAVGRSPIGYRQLATSAPLDNSAPHP